MSDATFNWADSWTLLSTLGISDQGSLSSAAISNDGKIASEVSVTLTYGSTATEGAKVYIIRDIDGTNYEQEQDLPYGFSMPYSTSTTYRRAFTVRGDEASSFKILVTNDTGDSITAVVRTRQIDSVNIA
ncbi:hypothetical protein HED60_19420 [Planctomycetales bacterium ZRK34]|nr:hypothetical protein HED60_19420 [Planctomycetales bacterium ZRK34]